MYCGQPSPDRVSLEIILELPRVLVRPEGVEEYQVGVGEVDSLVTDVDGFLLDQVLARRPLQIEVLENGAGKIGLAVETKSVGIGSRDRDGSSPRSR